MPKQGQVNDFKKEVPGGVDAADATTFKFPRVVSKRFDGKESYYDVTVRIATGIPQNIKGAQVEKMAENFARIEDKYFDSKESLPAGYYGWYKVNYYAVAESDPGKGQKPTRVYVGKNVGKKNQTNPFTQALRDALGRYNKQIQKSQLDVAEDAGIQAELFPPMLAGGDAEDIMAVNFIGEKAAGRITRIQPKLNGTRGVACLNIKNKDSTLPTTLLDDAADTGGCILYTRKRKIIKGLQYIRDEALPVLNELRAMFGIRLRLDGEFYVHGVPLELISGAMRREKGGEASELKLQYHVFDIFSEDKIDAVFSERYNWMMELERMISAINLKYIKVVTADEVMSLGDIDAAYNRYLRDGFEGAIVRLDREYKYSYNDRRAKWLMKKKPVLDAEFEIVGYSGAEKGKASGWLIFILKTKEGKTFNLSNFGERGDELRQKMYEEMSKPDPEGKLLPNGTAATIFDTKYKGKFITVLFDEWSRFRVPLRARTEGIVIRDYD